MFSNHRFARAASTSIAALVFSSATIAATGGAAAATTEAAIVRDAIGTSPAARGIAAYPAAERLGFHDLGRLEANASVHLGIVLRYRNEAELAQLTMLQGNRKSALYHHYLSNAQWNAYFAPSTIDVRRDVVELERRGLRVTRVLPNNTLIDVTSDASTVERLFRTELHRTLQTNGHGYAYANVRAAAMPPFLSAFAVSVAGLHTTDVARYPLLRTRRTMASIARFAPSAAATTTPKPITTSTPQPNPNPDPTLAAGPTNVHGTSGGYGPVAFAVSYDEPDMHGYDGTGVNVGSVISGDFADADLKEELADFGITHTGTTTRVPVDTYFVPSSMSSTPDVGESSLDVEAILGLAPGANFYEYLINGLTDISIEDGYNRVVSDNTVETLNTSLGGCEADDPAFGFAVNYLAMQGAAKGITFNASTGDNGGNGCGFAASNGTPGTIKGIAVPAAAYYFTGVGGTDLVANADTGARVSETGWETGGGGVSTVEALPSWQSAAVAAGVDPQMTGRNLPDVAFDASLETGYQTVIGGMTSPVGGTSLAGPIFTATQTMIDQVQGSRNGWVNPRLYAIQQAIGYGFAFYDIVVGQNEDYVCGLGYDNVTGIGAISGWELAGTE